MTRTIPERRIPKSILDENVRLIDNASQRVKQ
jgi:hypothetical protein